MNPVPNDDGLGEVRALVGGLAHELKNPLSTMVVTLQLLREEWTAEKNSLAARSLSKIDVLMEETRRLETMLADFLKLAAKGEPDLQAEDLNLIVEQVSEFLSTEFADRGIEIVSQLDRGLSTVQVDKNLVRQALLNVFKNAAEAIDAEVGTITVFTRRDGDLAAIEVIDTGRGMTESTRQDALNVYFSTKPQGAGLGLPMVRRIVEQHEGNLDFESAPGFGTRFVLRFPFAETIS